MYQFAEGKLRIDKQIAALLIRSDRCRIILIISGMVKVHLIHPIISGGMAIDLVKTLHSLKSFVTSNTTGRFSPSNNIGSIAESFQNSFAKEHICGNFKFTPRYLSVPSIHHFRFQYFSGFFLFLENVVKKIANAGMQNILFVAKLFPDSFLE